MIADCSYGQAVASNTRTVAVVLFYDGEAALRRAMLTADHLGSEAVGVRLRAWSFEMLEEANGKDLAGGWLALADVVMIAALKNQAVPPHILQLLIQCMASDEGPLIPLIGLGVIPADGGGLAPQCFFDSLAGVAREAGMCFFQSTVSWAKLPDAKEGFHAHL